MICAWGNTKRSCAQHVFRVLSRFFIVSSSLRNQIGRKPPLKTAVTAATRPG
jgi:hypothetical protein